MIAGAILLGILQLGQAAQMARVEQLLQLDSVVAAAGVTDAMIASGGNARTGQLAAMFGRLDAAAGSMADLDPAPGTTAALLQLASGSVPLSLSAIEASLLGDAGDDWRRRSSTGSALQALTQLGFALRGTGPALFATTRDQATLLLVNRAARDTAAVRQLIGAADAAARTASARTQAPPLALAEAELWLGDSAAALERLLRFERRWTAMDPSVTWGMVGNGWTLGRTWMLLGNLARARGRVDDAARAYRRVAELWSGGDASLRERAERARVLADGTSTVGDTILTTERVLLRATINGDERFRYDAVAWVRMPFQLSTDQPMLVAKTTLMSSESATRDAAGVVTWTQRFDSAALELPVLANLGGNGVAMLRRAQAGLRGLQSVTTADSTGRWLRRETTSSEGVPGELARAMAASGGFGPLGAAITFPARAVAAGETWTDSATLYAPAGVLAEDTRALVRYTLLRVEHIGGSRIAFIAIAAETGERVADDGRSSATLSGELVWDVDAGVAIRLAASLRAVTLDRFGAETPARVLMTALRQPRAPVENLAMRTEVRSAETQQ